jgi:hypothetical protein
LFRMPPPSWARAKSERSAQGLSGVGIGLTT